MPFLSTLLIVSTALLPTALLPTAPLPTAPLPTALLPAVQPTAQPTGTQSSPTRLTAALLPALDRAGTGEPPAAVEPPGAAGAVPGPATTAVALGAWAWPLIPQPEVVRGFAVGPLVWSAGHRGVDLAATVGAAIHAPQEGTVFFTGVIAGRPVLSLDHGSGVFSSFEPVISRLHRGQQVRRGEVIGVLDGTAGHCSPAACLHWGVRRTGIYVDPLSLLGGTTGSGRSAADAAVNRIRPPAGEKGAAAGLPAAGVVAAG